MVLEAIDSNKFKKLELNQLAEVLGGKATGKGQFTIKHEIITKPTQGGVATYQRDLIRYYTSDELGEDECFYGVEDIWTDWYWTGTQE
ncbi:hypothetical protein [Sphingobacterium siyangense]|uniref:hypothetical protein n=1 Tax=Sphingobacterium siyangense TaxID=459529 RepID=UPI003DA207AA